MAALSPLISTAELADAPDVRIVDATWRLGGGDFRSEHHARRLPGAVYFDLDAVSDRASGLPHMLPSPGDFAAAVGALGVAEDDRVVVYDDGGMAASARVWWTFRVMGARRAQVLDGGLKAWLSEGRPTESGPAAHPALRTFTPDFDVTQVAAFDDVARAVLMGDAQIIDARAADRFAGAAPEPREGLRSGHMPGALNLPFLRLLEADGRLKGAEGLAAAFRQAGLAPDKPIITSCGSGVTASLLTLALAVLGRRSRVYDGSWAEWGARADAPVETG